MLWPIVLWPIRSATILVTGARGPVSHWPPHGFRSAAARGAPDCIENNQENNYAARPGRLNTRFSRSMPQWPSGLLVATGKGDPVIKNRNADPDSPTDSFGFHLQKLVANPLNYQSPSGERGIFLLFLVGHRCHDHQTNGLRHDAFVVCRSRHGWLKPVLMRSAQEIPARSLRGIMVITFQCRWMQFRCRPMSSIRTAPSVLRVCKK